MFTTLGVIILLLLMPCFALSLGLTAFVVWHRQERADGGPRQGLLPGGDPVYDRRKHKPPWRAPL